MLSSQRMKICSLSSIHSLHLPKVCAVSHQISVADVMLDEAAAYDDHARLDGRHGHRVDQPQI